MANFGFVSSMLTTRTRWEKFIPEKWLYYRGPVNIGRITGFLPGGDAQGMGWQLPGYASQIWSNYRVVRIWQKFLSELDKYGIRVVGLDCAATFTPTASLRTGTAFPGVSDGKALELLLFINRFRGILRNYEIPSLKAKATIIWEEGNLGVTCARLIAREVRFLNLVSPNARSLERAAELVFAETGISAQIYQALPDDLRGCRIIIKCGMLSKLKLVRSLPRIIWCEIFQKSPSLTSFNTDLPIIVKSRYGGLPLYPALGEAIVRSRFNLIDGFWYGSELPLERVIKLALCFRELGREFTV
ncbi:MAG TPA: hypothetical protein DDW50_18290 [Firmicutes bacterium]|jgi:hypothetical protein|nr:hypothetical protein [Bacillota bacterium]